jgi:Cupredoxin-like domain
MKRILLILVVMAVLAGLAVAINKDDKKTDNPTTTNTSNVEQNPTTQPADDTDKGSVQTITYINGGFSPEKLTSKSGENVVIENKSSETIQFNSDEHPQHSNNPELNVGTVAPGEKKTFVLTSLGTFGFHNHLKPDATGEIVVQ